jgi:acetyl esterase/lipase
MSRPSYTENGDGYVLTAGLMRCSRDHYTEPGQRTDPAVAPLQGRLDDLPPAIVVTAEFDPAARRGDRLRRRAAPPAYRSSTPRPAATRTRR